MKRTGFITGCLIALLVSACNKELSNNDNFNSYSNSPLNDTVWTRAFLSTAAVHDLADALAPGIIIDSFNIEQGATLHYGDSMEIEIKANSCVVPGGGSQSGLARLQIIPLKRKGDFIRFFKPATAENGILVSGGGVFIRAVKEEKELSLAQGATIHVKFSDIDSIRANMQAFYGRESNPLPLRGIDTAFSWARDSDTTWLRTWSKQGPGASTPSYYGYELNAKNLRWIAAERYIDTNAAKVKVTAILSPNFTNKNTAVFLVFDKQKTVVGLKPDYPSRSFNAQNIPLGTQAKLISLSKIGGDYYLGIETIASVANVIRYTIKPEKKSLKDILSYLNTL